VTNKRERSPLEVALGFRIDMRKDKDPEHRVGSLIWSSEDGTDRATRPATVAEIQMWEWLQKDNAATQVLIDALKRTGSLKKGKDEVQSK